MRFLGMLGIAALVAAGCGSANETTYVAPDGTKATVSNNGGNTTYTDDKGNSMTAAKDGSNISVKDAKGNTFDMGKDVTEAELGLPFYSGSTEKPNASMKATENGVTSVISSRTTKDAPSKVVEFYKDKVESPDASNTNSAGTDMSMLRGKLKDGSEVTITAIKSGDADTDISVAVKHTKA